MERQEDELQRWRDNYNEEKETNASLFKENKALKEQMNQQHEELQEIKKKLKEILNQ